MPISRTQDYETRVHEFDADTQVEQISPGEYRGRVTSRWSIGTVPNGGYVMSIGMRALAHALSAADPLSVTGHFLRPATPGELDVRVDVIKRGRRYSTATAELRQDGKEILRLLGTYGDLSAHSGPTRVTGAPPVVPAPGDETQTHVGRGLPAIAERFELRFAKETMRWLDGAKTDEAEIRGAIRFRDRRPPDTLSLGVIADAFPPPVFAVIPPRWLPTLELTVHFRARPRTEWLHSVFRTRFLFGGFLEEDGEIWDEEGRLVALSRQLAMVPA